MTSFLDPHRLDDADRRSDPEGRDQRYVDGMDLLTRIELLLEQGTYQFAADTLQGIYDTVSRTGKATPGQVKAIDNIESSRTRTGRRWR